MDSTHDAIIIGSGQAGPFLAVRLAQAGMKVALIEREHYGGTCVNDGCIPTKTIVASARTAQVARRAVEYGVEIGGPVRVDMKAVIARKNRVVQQSIDGLTQWLQGTAGLERVWGHARFAGPDCVEVDARVFRAPKIFVNVGGRVLPDWPGLDQVSVLTNTSIMQLDVLPGHLIVASGSYIGLEFAQMFRRFGAEVTVLEVADRLIAR
jgi:pyruvate/2-oxoglutarate dehydrogenase complex dihydrolipoamide dehydrogenase (E3) component